MPSNPCPTGKISYASQDEARTALSGLRSRHATQCKVYRCSDGCDGWHLGNARPMITGDRKGRRRW